MKINTWVIEKSTIDKLYGEYCSALDSYQTDGYSAFTSVLNSAAAVAINEFIDSNKLKDAAFSAAPTPNTTGKPTGSILEEAQQIIYGDREKTYGHPSKNLSLIAEYWSGHISARLGENISLTVDDICVMMVLLKQARLANDPTHRDSKVDTAGYAALMQRCQDYTVVGTTMSNCTANKNKRPCTFPNCNCQISPVKAG